MGGGGEIRTTLGQSPGAALARFLLLSFWPLEKLVSQGHGAEPLARSTTSLLLAEN